MFIIRKKHKNHRLNLQITVNLLFEQFDYKQRRINSNMVILLTSKYLIWTKRKGHTVHIKTQTKNHTYSKGYEYLTLSRNSGFSNYSNILRPLIFSLNSGNYCADFHPRFVFFIIIIFFCLGSPCYCTFLNVINS